MADDNLFEEIKERCVPHLFANDLKISSGNAFKKHGNRFVFTDIGTRKCFFYVMFSKMNLYFWLTLCSS